MKIILGIIVLLLSFSGILFVYQGHTIDPVVDLSEKALTLTVYKGGRPGKEVPVASDSVIVARINSLLLKKRGKWKRSFVTFAPVIIIRGEKISINCQRDRIIINFENSAGQTVQVVTSLATEEYSQIENAAGNLKSDGRLDGSN